MQHRFVWTMLATVAVAACSDSNGPTRQELVGDYEATVFTTTRDSVTVDQLDEGGRVYLRLRSDKAIQAVTIVPPDAINEDGEELKPGGIWKLDGTTVRLVSEDETFLTEFRFHAVDSTLVGKATFGTTRADLVLSPRQVK